MDTKIFQQSIDLIVQANTIAIALPQNPDGDVLGASGGLALALTEFGKTVRILTPSSFFVPEKYKFLHLFSQLFSKQDEVALCINCPSITAVRYEKTADGLMFFITPKEGNIDQKNVVLKPSFGAPDIVITIGVPDRETLGISFPELTSNFFEAPLLNIDNNPANEKFGTINLLSLTSSSKTEVVKKLIEDVSWGKNLLNEKSATYFLFGIVCATRNFQSPKTNPSTLLAGASLILKGARHQEIIQHLYKTKPFEGLKALGEIMQRLTKEGELAWASFTKEDCKQLSLNPGNIAFAAEELKDHFFNPVSFFLLWEKLNPGGTEGILFSPSENILFTLAEKIGGEIRQGLLFFSAPQTNIITLEQKLTAFLRAHLPKIE